MPTTTPERSPEEVDRLGEAVYNRVVRPNLRPEDIDKFVAIEVDTGDYEIDESDHAAMDRLHARVPNAEVWTIRAGRDWTYKLRLGL